MLTWIKRSTVVKVLWADNALELGSSKEAIEFFHNQGILHQTSVADTPQQNGVVQRKHRHLLEVCRALLFQPNLPLHLWGHCLLTSRYLINRFPSTVLKGITPYEALFRIKPSYSHLKSFGCLCYVNTRRKGRININLKPKFVSSLDIQWAKRDTKFLI